MNEVHEMLTNHILSDLVLYQLNLLKSMHIDFFELINSFFPGPPTGRYANG